MKVRSVLYLPASNPRAIEKARTLDCDVAVLDLEDAVAPKAKADARVAAIEAAVAGGFGPKLAVRINALDTPWAEEDLQSLKDAPVSLIVAPKIEDDQQVKAISDVLRLDQQLWAMVETPKALVDLKDIASAGGVLSGLMLGVNDLAKEMKTGPSPGREPFKPWLAAVVAHARANRLVAIDGVFNRIKDEDGFAAEAAQGRLYGFDGKSLIHPSQIAPANAAFGPSPAEIEWAQKVVAAFDRPESEGQGVIRLEGEMVERLHLEQAKALLADL
ncbi:CoA ester lyase [Brevundimonas sp.]|uniref:HpcH/HpaI aldolase/citrate lyase family protein n=1 Tax=Brevundimonas sp. TaxID=1871086 RepID=UPI0028982499|nr:CoA ester lyase [Brevundimonas sp.]